MYFEREGKKLWVKAERKNFSKSDKKFNYHHYFLMSLGLLNFIFDNFWVENDKIFYSFTASNT